MGLPRPRRIALGVLVGSTIVAVLLLIAQDQQTLELKSARGAAEPAHAPAVSSSEANLLEMLFIMFTS